MIDSIPKIENLVFSNAFFLRCSCSFKLKAQINILYKILINYTLGFPSQTTMFSAPCQPLSNRRSSMLPG
jgi:hypothetical protein